jgi:hypothetical protein
MGTYQAQRVREAAWNSRPTTMVRKKSAESGFDLQTVQPIASRYTD